MAPEVSTDERAVAKGPGPVRAPLRSGGWGPADITAILELTRRPPVPQLFLPITAQESPPAPRARSTDDVAEALAMPVGSLRLVPPVLTAPPPERRASWFADFRRSEAASILGFALAWVTTTAAGALSMGHLLARTQTPIIVHVPERVAIAESAPAAASCAPSWTPPLVALADLPVAGPRPAAPPAWSSERPARSHDAAAGSAPRNAFASSARRRAVAPPAAKAKTAAPPPKSLEDWMKASVGGSGS